jgi:hypothetical protein
MRRRGKPLPCFSVGLDIGRAQHPAPALDIGANNLTELLGGVSHCLVALFGEHLLNLRCMHDFIHLLIQPVNDEPPKAPPPVCPLAGVWLSKNSTHGICGAATFNS